LLGLFEIGAGWLFNKNVFARIHAINSRLQNPFFIHNAIDDIEIGFAEHLFVICIYLRKLVFFRNLIQAFFIEFANRAHLDILLQAMDIWIMRALTASPCTDKSCFKHYDLSPSSPCSLNFVRQSIHTLAQGAIDFKKIFQTWAPQS